jgi:hypothetical protein
MTEDWERVPRECCYLVGTAWTNKVHCEQVENEAHTWYVACESLRNTGRCKHPGPLVGDCKHEEERRWIEKKERALYEELRRKYETRQDHKICEQVL